MKRLVISTIASIALAALLTSEAAAAGATIDTFPVSFTVTAAQCHYLPAGTTLNGSGTEKSITTTRVDRNGVVTIENSSHATGTATDQDGNTYVFNYSNEFRATLEGDVLSGLMTDSFALSGRGPARLNNGFVGHFVSDFATFFTVPDVINSHGDPLNFVTGEAHCDPL